MDFPHGTDPAGNYRIRLLHRTKPQRKTFLIIVNWGGFAARLQSGRG
jgi:hypothetical protein